MDREHDRIPLSVEVRFRTTSSFLFAYSVNLSKGGMFLETASLAPVGSQITLVFQIADRGAFEVKGTVTWHRTKEDTVGLPPGMGVEFEQIDDANIRVVEEILRRYDNQREHRTTRRRRFQQAALTTRGLRARLVDDSDGE